MKIGIVDFDSDYANGLKEKLSKQDWDISVVEDELSCSSYDAVLIGRQDNLSIVNQCDTEIAVIGDVTEELAFNDSINAIINKNDIEEIIEWLRYVDVKLRLKVNAEQLKVSFTPHHKKEEYKDVLIKLTDDFDKQEIFDKIREMSYRCVVYFDETIRSLYSSHLNMLVIIWKYAVKDNGGKIALWKAGRNGEVVSKFKMCRIDTLIPYYDKIEDAVFCIKLNKN